MKIVVDTNVFIHAIFQGRTAAREVLRLEHKGLCQIVVSIPIVDEWMYTITEHGIEAGKTLQDMKKPYVEIARCLSRCERVTPQQKVELSKDPEDNKFIECAIEGNASYIITSDYSDLHSIKDPIINKNKEVVRVVSPGQFMAAIMKSAMTSGQVK